MIRLTCKCGKHYEIAEKYAGKKVRCKVCSEIFIIPTLNRDKHQTNPLEYSNPTSNETLEGDNYSKRPEPTYTFPVWAWLLCGVVGVFFVSFILWAFVFRDTWEIDNYARMDNLYIEGLNLIATEDFTTGLDKYKELIELVGDRNLRYQRLKEFHHKAQEEYDIIKPKWDGIYKPLLSKHQEVQSLIRSMKYDESIKACNSIIEKHAIYKNDSVVRKKLDGFRKLKEQAEVRWQQAINNERNGLLPKLIALKEQAYELGKVDKWDMAIVCLQKVIDAEPEIIWTDEVRATIGYANIQIINARHLPIMVNLFKQAYELSQKNQWDDVSDRLQKLIDIKPNISTPEIDKVVKNAYEQLAKARMVLKEGKQLAEKLKRLEEERRYVEDNTTIVQCPKCFGTGRCTIEEYRRWASVMSDYAASFSGVVVLKPPACSLCKGKGKLKKVFDKYYLMD